MSTSATMDACFHYWKSIFWLCCCLKIFMLLSQNLQLVPSSFDFLVVSSVSVSQRLEGHGAGFIINGKTLFLQVP